MCSLNIDITSRVWNIVILIQKMLIVIRGANYKERSTVFVCEVEWRLRVGQTLVGINRRMSLLTASFCFPDAITMLRLQEPRGSTEVDFQTSSVRWSHGNRGVRLRALGELINYFNYENFVIVYDWRLKVILFNSSIQLHLLCVLLYILVKISKKIHTLWQSSQREEQLTQKSKWRY